MTGITELMAQVNDSFLELSRAQFDKLLEEAITNKGILLVVDENNKITLTVGIKVNG